MNRKGVQTGQLKSATKGGHCGGSVAEPKKRGRKAHITLDVVKRVSERFGLGLPLEMALCLEKDPNINEGSWRMALARNPEFVRAFKAAKAEFLEQSFNFLARHEDWRARVTFLERRHAVDFAKPAETINVNHTNLTDAELESIASGRSQGTTAT